MIFQTNAEPHQVDLSGDRTQIIMDDAELNAIRAARLQEMRKDGNQSPETNKSDEMKSSVLSQILETGAKDRLSRVRMVKPERAEAVEQYIIKLAQSGQLRRKLGEPEVVEILDGISRDENSQKQTRIVFDRKTIDDDDDDFFD